MTRTTRIFMGTFVGYSCLFASFASAQPPVSDESAGPVFEKTTESYSIPYRIELVETSGNIPAAITREFEAESLLVHDQKKGIVSETVARKKIHQDALLLTRVCYRYGYFNVEIKEAVDFQPTFAVMHYAIDLGPRYTISAKKVTILDDSAYVLPRVHDVLPVLAQEHVSFPNIIAERKRLKYAFRDEGFYCVHIEKPRVHVRARTRTIQVEYIARKGNLVTVDHVRLLNHHNVPEQFILRRVPLHPGDVLRQSALDRAHSDLMDTGLFANVRIHGQTTDPTASRNIVNVEVTEAPSRVIGVGAHYTASEGAVGTVIWRNKNFLNKAHQFGILATLGTKEMAGTLFYDFPDVLATHQKLHSEITYKHLNMKAYEGEKFEAVCGMIRRFRFKKYEMNASILPVAEFSELSRHKSYRQNLFGIRTNLNINLTNHRLYPTSGVILNIDIQPYWGSFARLLEESTPSHNLWKRKKGAFDVNKNIHNLTVCTGSITGYVPLRKHMALVPNSTLLAAFVTAGTVAIKDFEYLPFDKRFYGGGRNSIRSYGYQLSGELDDKGDPIGGASIFEACIEPRVRISEDFGAVIFWDCSYVSPKKFPDFSQTDNFLHGCGFGIRYFTRFGPIRLDLAFPFKRRTKKDHEKVDKAIQFYISVGQNF